MNSEWKVRDRFYEKITPWLTIVGEHLIDDKSQVLEYWRLEKADSVIILPIYRQQLLLPHPQYRPGIGKPTLDFPGGRLPQGEHPKTVVPDILHRELGIEPQAIADINSLNSRGWTVNSSFSTQKMFGFWVNLDPQLTLTQTEVGQRYPITLTGISSLLENLHCLQCRSVLLDWWVKASHT